MIKVGDYVCLSGDSTIIYRVYSILDSIACIKGINKRIIRYVNLTLLENASVEVVNKKTSEMYDVVSRLRKDKSKRDFVNRNYKALFGTILHIDGDETFLNSCVSLYKELHIHSYGVAIKEKDVYLAIDSILDDISPDIIVITGHDYFNGKDKKDINNYENSKSFCEAIRKIRRRFYKDDVVIIAGACGSCFESLIACGANFASSPNRVNIHAYDPAVIAIKCATTSNKQSVNFEDCLKYIENGREAFGGIETNGKMKLML